MKRRTLLKGLVGLPVLLIVNEEPSIDPVEDSGERVEFYRSNFGILDVSYAGEVIPFEEWNQIDLEIDIHDCWRRGTMPHSLKVLARDRFQVTG